MPGRSLWIIIQLKMLIYATQRLWNKVIRLTEKIKICGTKKYTELEKSFNLPQKNTKVRDGPSQRQYNILEEQNKSLKARAYV